jgi:hypothetical protein
MQTAWVIWIQHAALWVEELLEESVSEHYCRALRTIVWLVEIMTSRWIWDIGQVENLETWRCWETDSQVLWFPPPPGILEARICTGIGLPVPEPPQLLHRIMPVPLQVPQPTSLSDHLVHTHGTLLDPLHVAQRNPPAIGFWSSVASRIDLMAHAPASTLNPCATCCIATPGDMPPLYPRYNTWQKERNPRGHRQTVIQSHNKN